MFQVEESKNLISGPEKCVPSRNKKYKPNSQSVIPFAGIVTQRADGQEGILKMCQRCGIPFVATGNQRFKRNYCSARCRSYAATDRWCHSNPARRAGHYRKYYTLKQYKLSPEGFEELIKQQENKCAICHREFSGKLRPCIDHDHACCPTKTTCGKCIRGLLCLGCNGWMEKLSNPNYKKAVDEYLCRYKH